MCIHISSNSFTTSICPLKTATNRAVVSLCMVAFTSALLMSNTFTASVCPFLTVTSVEPSSVQHAFMSAFLYSNIFTTSACLCSAATHIDIMPVVYSPAFTSTMFSSTVSPLLQRSFHLYMHLIVRSQQLHYFNTSIKSSSKLLCMVAVTFT